MQHVFIYGTLRAGEINDIRHAAAKHGLPAPKLLGTTHIAGMLYDFGTYPGLVLDPAGAPVQGDIYRIDDALVPVLDEIEEVYPGVEGLFRPHRVRVSLDGTAGTIECLMYPVAARAVEGLPRIEGGDWVTYRKSAKQRA
jgi:gamma-glutamylcyclotransferase (GGCT)/AIG2-like uncharacterized protein YtfP